MVKRGYSIWDVEKKGDTSRMRLTSHRIPREYDIDFILSLSCPFLVLSFTQPALTKNLIQKKEAQLRDTLWKQSKIK